MTPRQRAVLQALAKSYRAVSLNPRDAVPEVLYHYSSGRGFLGIISSGVLRASNFSYLNDATELRYGSTLVDRVVTERLASEAKPSVRRVLESVRQVLDEVGKGLDFYIACFCTDSDRLSQWRGYGSATGRYCLGFESEALWNASPQCRLARVVYKEGEQLAQVRRVLDKALEALQTAPVQGPANSDFVRRVASLLADRIVGRLCFFKHPGFKEEREWRLVHKLEGLGKIQFDSSGGLLKPFVEISFGSVGSSLRSALPLRELVVGSGSLALEARKSAELLLATHGYPDVAVQESVVPYRDVL